MQELSFNKADAVQEQPGTPEGKQATAPEPEGTAEKADDKGKKQRRRRGRGAPFQARRPRQAGQAREAQQATGAQGRDY